MSCGVVGIDFDLLAQPVHLHVDRAVMGACLAAPRLLEQEVARQNPPRVFSERPQQIELAARQRHVLALRVEAHAGADGPQFELPKPIGAGSMPTMRVKRAA